MQSHSSSTSSLQIRSARPSEHWKTFSSFNPKKIFPLPRNIKLCYIITYSVSRVVWVVYSFSGFLIVSRALYIPPDTNNNILWRKFLFKLFWRALAFFRKTYIYSRVEHSQLCGTLLARDRLERKNQLRKTKFARISDCTWIQLGTMNNGVSGLFEIYHSADSNLSVRM